MSHPNTHRLQNLVAGVVLIHSVLFILFWLTNRLFYTATNDYLVKMLGMRWDFITILLVITALVGLWSGARLWSYKVKTRQSPNPVIRGLYISTGLIFILFFYGSFWLLFKESPVQLPRLGQMILYFRLIPDTLVLVGVALVLGLEGRRVLLCRKTVNLKVTVLSLLVSVLAIILLWVVPVIYPPDSIFQGSLPPKPLLIAHRGASMLAPENTLASAALAARLGVYGLETDIHLSSDGKLFLLHDDTFVRTTDIKTVFPDRASDRAEYFTLAEATRLNAGKWFVERDPYQTIRDGQVSDSQVEEYLLQTIPPLADWLQIVQHNHLAFIFDLKQPPGDQPYAETFLEICLNEIKKYEIDEQVWLLAGKDQLELVHSIAPAMKLAFGVDYQTPPSVDELKASGYQIVNAEYALSKDWIQKYQDANLWVNLYTIDESWQYSRLWLLRVNSTTTNNAHALIVLDHPILSLPFTQYLVLWCSVGVLSLGVFLGLSLPVFRRSSLT